MPSQKMSGSIHTFREWIDPRVEVRKSSTDGTGLFARESFLPGETVITLGGDIFTKEQFDQGKIRYESAVTLQENLVLGYGVELPPVPSDFLNHSCTPNVGMRDALNVITISDVDVGEEFTNDYAFFCAFGILTPFECNCGTLNCRKVITSNDWQLDILQERYGNYFSPRIRRK